MKYIDEVASLIVWALLLILAVGHAPQWLFGLVLVPLLIYLLTMHATGKRPLSQLWQHYARSKQINACLDEIIQEMQGVPYVVPLSVVEVAQRLRRRAKEQGVAIGFYEACQLCGKRLDGHR